MTTLKPRLRAPRAGTARTLAAACLLLGYAQFLRAGGASRDRRLPGVPGRQHLEHPGGFAACRSELACSNLLPGATYSLERSTDPNAATWQPVDQFAPAQPSATRTTQRVPAAATMFYRLRL